MSLLCKLGFHKWETKGRTTIRSTTNETSWKVAQKCKKCGKTRRIMKRERK
jgi:hypothetical protein